MKHFISIGDISKEDLFSILQTAELYRENEFTLNQKLFAANLFYEPSTRTKMSFTVAERKLGMEVLDFHTETSSAQKGESLYDTAKTFEAIGADVIVIRHTADDWFRALENKMSIPVINAGAGKLEHPTQCLLDLLTIYQEFGGFENLNVLIAGDISHSRVARSNAFALEKLGANVYLSVAPGFEDAEMDFPYVSMDEGTKDCDVVMLLRIQHERHHHQTETNDYLKNFGLTKERERHMKAGAIILHPAPINRGVEIDDHLVECRRSRIFKQMENGVYTRMALLVHLLREWGILNEDTVKERKTTIAR